MKKIISVIFICCFFNAVIAQSESEILEIQSSGKYLYGIGQADNYRQADHNALDHLITQITVKVESYFEGKTTEIEGDVKEFAQSVVK
ncbi:MAG: hypothetical protein K9H16_07720, partial [Bacteroidales bacterium]|nr:hypothetical protein [Bacteroidales bacterium]